MYLIFATIVSSLLLPASAAPQAIPSPAAPASAPIHTNRTPDKCGPVTQGPSDPPDSCTAKPVAVSTAASFGVLGSIPEHGWELAGIPFDWDTVCAPTVTDICNTMQRSNTTAGAWYFATGPTATDSQEGHACQMGFWLPNDDPLKSAKSDPNAAQKPSMAQCTNIFNSIVATAAASNNSVSFRPFILV